MTSRDQESALNAQRGRVASGRPCSPCRRGDHHRCLGWCPCEVPHAGSTITKTSVPAPEKQTARPPARTARKQSAAPVAAAAVAAAAVAAAAVAARAPQPKTRRPAPAVRVSRAAETPASPRRRRSPARPARETEADQIAAMVLELVRAIHDEVQVPRRRPPEPVGPSPVYQEFERLMGTASAVPVRGAA